MWLQEQVIFNALACCDNSLKDFLGDTTDSAAISVVSSERTNFVGLCFFLNLYLMNAPDPFKSASCESTKWVHCGHLNAPHRFRIIAPPVISTLYNVLWSDSCSGHCTQICTYARHE